jgi:hypothetical protein
VSLLLHSPAVAQNKRDSSTARCQLFRAAFSEEMFEQSARDEVLVLKFKAAAAQRVLQFANFARDAALASAVIIIMIIIIPRRAPAPG